MSSELPPLTEKPPSRGNRWPHGLLGMIVLILGFESYLMARDADFTTLVANNWRAEGGAPAKFARRNEILCFGDSMVKFGIQPKILQDRLGMKAYNFALYNGAAPSSYYMLKRSFDSGAKPRAIVVDFQPELIMGDSMVNNSRVYPELLTISETAELCWTARDPGRFAEFLVYEILPSARKRFEIRESILASIKGGSASIKEKIVATERNWKINRGAEVLPKNPYFDGMVPTTGAYPAMFWTPWFVHPLNEKYIERFLELAHSKGIPVFWALQPNAASVDAQREKVGYNAQYEVYVKRCQARFPNLVVVDGRHVNYPREFFTDPVHLDRDGASACTLGLVDVMRAYLLDHTEKFDQVAARWHALPDHRGESRAIPLEDGIESSLAIKAEQAKVRR